MIFGTLVLPFSFFRCLGIDSFTRATQTLEQASMAADFSVSWLAPFWGRTRERWRCVV